MGGDKDKDLLIKSAYLGYSTSFCKAKYKLKFLSEA